MQYAQIELQGKSSLSAQEHQQRWNRCVKKPTQNGLMEKEFQFNLQLTGAENSVIEQREDKKEKAKDDHTKNTSNPTI